MRVLLDRERESAGRRRQSGIAALCLAAALAFLPRTTSADDLGDPDAPLDFGWEIDDPAHRIVRGALDEPLVVLTLAGTRVVTVQLTVTNLDGLSASLSGTVGLTIAE